MFGVRWAPADSDGVSFARGERCTLTPIADPARVTEITATLDARGPPAGICAAAQRCIAAGAWCHRLGDPESPDRGP